MKKSILKLGKALNKTEQKKVNGGSPCDYYINNGLCFGPVPGCLPCGQMSGYPGASRCVLVHASCMDEGELN
ncbi:hypothetical protein [Tenacibaculum aiptasiae]|uniref:hypothetical protein n=1 Tax=Tenacibaculum aiptasiae TaxID=426481 RepID=UPI00232DD392|nr:hypothetical protein [Tenacibaculum aiptasiae]